MGEGAKIVIRRLGGYRDLIRSYKIVLDGEVVGKIKQKREATIDVAPGEHTLRMKIDWTGSPEIPFTISAGETLEFVCRPAGTATDFGDLASKDAYIDLRLSDSSPS